MDCLHCGHCCETMSPFDAPAPCRHIARKTDPTGAGPDFVLCAIYKSRPDQCRNHRYPASKCPIGIGILNVQSPDQAHRRIDGGYKLTQAMKEPTQ